MNEAKKGLKNINISINSISNEELYNIVQVYKRSFEQYINSYEKSLEYLNNYSIETESIIKTIKEDAVLSMQEGNMLYDEFKNNN